VSAAQPQTVAWMIYLGLFPTAIGFTTWAYALSRTTAGKLGSTTYLVPPIVIVMSLVVLSEVPPLLSIAGGVLCVLGVIVARSHGALLWRRPAPVEA
jgi:drug/metabolite transporter (DMT)-like permease